MHEMSIAQNLFTAISAQAKKHNAKPVGAKISCGMLNAVNDELLKEALSAISSGTSCESIRLEIEHKPLRGVCRRCGKEFDVDFKTGRCSSCNEEDFELQPDAALVLEEIELEGKQDESESR